MGTNPNNKKLIIIGVILIVVIILVLALFVFKPTGDPADLPENPPTPGGDTTIKTASEKIIVEDSGFTISDSKRTVKAVIPKFYNLSDYAFSQYMNNKMSATANHYQDEISSIVDEKTPTTAMYKYFVTYDRYNNENFISLVINHNYQTGGMRSNAWKDTYNVDVVNNREVVLKDLFEATVDYQKVIVDEINKLAKDKGYELINGNGLKVLTDNQKFYIKEKVLYIYFDPAAIAPYVYGELHFAMPFTYNDGTFVVSAS